MSQRRVRVELAGPAADRAYEVIVGRWALAGLAETVRSLVEPRACRALVVVDTGVPAETARVLIGALGAQGLAVTVARLTPGEAMKDLGTVRGLLELLVAGGHTRVDPVVALGGGVVGDIAGFVAASYQRGVPVVQCPTTLLSMVDASVGGKTGVNLSVPGGSGGTSLYKNMVGAFHQPLVVCADVGVLGSLDARQFRSGLAECVKHAMIGDGIGGPGAEHAGLLGWMNRNRRAILGGDPETITELVARNVALKARVVMGDERESPVALGGGRMLLNFGHTFGHAIETLGGVGVGGAGGLTHGEAVALGMVAACAAGAALGMCDASVGAGLGEMLVAFGLPTRATGLGDDDGLIERMGHDKKAAGGALRVILPTGRGKCAIVENPGRGALAAGWASIRA